MNRVGSIRGRPSSGGLRLLGVSTNRSRLVSIIYNTPGMEINLGATFTGINTGVNRVAVAPETLTNFASGNVYYDRSRVNVDSSGSNVVRVASSIGGKASLGSVCRVSSVIFRISGGSLAGHPSL